MIDLNRPFREQLKRQCTITQLAIEQCLASDDGTKTALPAG
jgi:hypothetical protein